MSTPELMIEDVSGLSQGVSLSEMSLFSIAVSLKRIADALVNGGQQKGVGTIQNPQSRLGEAMSTENRRQQNKSDHVFDLKRELKEAADELARLRTLQSSLFDAIKHGDENHQAWLNAAINAHFSGAPMPPSEATTILVFIVSKPASGMNRMACDHNAGIKLDEFRAGKDAKSLDDEPGGHYSGYLCDAEEMIERLRARGFDVVPLSALPSPPEEGK